MAKLNVCTPEAKVEVVLDTFACRCKYHGKLRKNRYGFNMLAPRGLCPDLFYAIYPYCLALLYDASFDKKKKTICLRCPNSEANVKVEVEARPIIWKPLFNRIEKWARKHWRPLSLTDKRIIIKIINSEAKCPRLHRSGQQFEFNIGFSSELCPASFHSLFPFIFLVSRKIKSRFSDKKGLIKAGCPDAKNVITYKIHGQYK